MARKKGIVFTCYQKSCFQVKDYKVGYDGESIQLRSIRIFTGTIKEMRDEWTDTVEIICLFLYSVFTYETTHCFVKLRLKDQQK